MSAAGEWVEALAPAKINLALHVIGQRDDGRHLLDSLIAFADACDVMRIRPAKRMSLNVTGPMATHAPSNPANLAWRAAEWFGTPPVEIELVKRLPAAAGIGGGSSDAAAMLRALSVLWKRPLPSLRDAAALGADVPACLHGRTCRVSGAGEIVEPAETLPNFHFLLVNPLIPVATAGIFAATRRKSNKPMPKPLPTFKSDRDACLWLAEQRNDLQPAAESAVPEIREVLDALASSNAPVIRMSGSGATCFAVSSDPADIRKAEAALRSNRRKWWIRKASSQAFN